MLLNVAPQLDSWDRADNRSQVQLGKFLDEADTLLVASRGDGPCKTRVDTGKEWWPGPGSNRRPSAFQADARTN